MIIRLFLFLSSLSKGIQEKLWKWCYQRISAAYKKRDLKFMNYGYANPGKATPPFSNEADEENRLFIQLYEHTLSEIDLKEKEVLEVGSGRGGGSDFVARYFAPTSMIGVDIAKNAVDLSNQFYQSPNLKFVEGNAGNLPFENDRFDVVFNVESSHCYANMDAFIAEVARVLKPGGIFAWADLRIKELMEKDDKSFMNSPLKLLHKENITSNVIQALEQISNRKKEAIQERVPRFLHSLFFEFWGVQGSKIYRRFQDGRLVYWSYRFQKPNPSCK